MYLGPAAWRPFNPKLLDGFNFEKGGGLVGGGVLEWGSHCVDLCQWAVGDCPPPVEYNPPKDGQLVARYENGMELIFRETGWIPLGSCPVRFEGETGWVEAGDSGKLVLSSPALLAGRTVAEIGGYPATFHVRDFLDCVKSRSQPKGNADAACNAHIACHAANIALSPGSPGEVRHQEERVHQRRTGQSLAIRSDARTVEAVSVSAATASGRTGRRRVPGSHTDDPKCSPCGQYRTTPSSMLRTDIMPTIRQFTRSAVLLAALLVMAAASARAADAPSASPEKEQELLAVLRSDAPPAEKAITCKLLAIHGSSAAVPDLAKLLPDEQLASWARIALEAIPGDAADEALRKAAESLQGKTPGRHDQFDRRPPRRQGRSTR